VPALAACVGVEEVIGEDGRVCVGEAEPAELL
jgi:hypothetical protein